MFQRLAYEPQSFIFLDLFTLPKFLIKEACIFFSFLDLACLVSQSHDKDGETIYGQNENAYVFGVAVAVLGMWFGMSLFAIDIFFSQARTSSHRKKLLLFEIYISCLMTLLFFASFLCLSRGWKRRFPAHPESADFGKNNARASITFALLSFIAWFVSTIIAEARYKFLNPVNTAYYASFVKQNDMKFTSFPKITDLQSPAFNAQRITSSSYIPPVY